MPRPDQPDANTCPICGKPSVPGRLHPFCSRRCSDVDLGRWFVGAYRVPTSGSEEELINEAESEN